MTDNKNFENEAVKLSNEQLENANGGYVVDRGAFYSDLIVDDTTGEVLAKQYNHSDAQKAARDLGVNDKIISKEQYKTLFGKDAK